MLIQKGSTQQSKTKGNNDWRVRRNKQKDRGMLNFKPQIGGYVEDFSRLYKQGTANINIIMKEQRMSSTTLCHSVVELGTKQSRGTQASFQKAC